MIRAAPASANAADPSSHGPRKISILGATGSIGTSTLDLIGRVPEAWQVVALTAQSNVDKLADLAIAHRAALAVIGDPSLHGALAARLAGTRIRVAAGPEAVVAAAAEPADCVMAAIIGAAGLRPTLEAVRQGRRVALANKECLVCAGDLLMDLVAQAGAELLPVDSEHSAVFQALRSVEPTAIERIVLTASGGPFRDWPLARIAAATPEQALRHPNWSMGAKITIDSATMMNKGLELIEAFHLFPVGHDQLDVVVHPQSIVHCLVSFADGSSLAQMSAPDMRTPIAVALAWPARMVAPTERLDLARLGQLTFEAPDETRFPALALARDALRRGGGAPAVLNAANEVAVAAFLERRIGILDIARTVSECLVRADSQGLLAAAGNLDDVLEIDMTARALAADILAGGARAIK
mgnify:CR=1 FL=1